MNIGRIEESLKNGIDFLSNRQLPSGEFCTMMWKRHKGHIKYVKSVFVTSFVIHSLSGMTTNLSKKIGIKATNFLLEEMEQDGFWRFFGKKSYIHIDLDDTCCALASLKEFDIKLDYHSRALSILRYRNDQGLFNTWVLDIDPPFEKKDNDIDWVVNANVLFFYGLLGYSIKPVERYMNHIVDNGMFKQRSLYYHSPFVFLYCLTRAYAEGNSALYYTTRIKDYLINVKNNRLYRNALDVALVTVSLLNCGSKPEDVIYLIEHLLNTQEVDGYWPKYTFFDGFGHTICYGSNEFTTAIALEGLVKYLRKVNE